MPTKPKEIRAVSAAVEKEGRFLLVRRGRAPAKGLFAFPGGRVEADESADQALARELLEETGLRLIHASPYREIVLRGDGPEQIYRLTVFCASVEAGEVTAGDDASEAGWFGRREIAAMPLTETTREMIDTLQNKAAR
ncbi:NUDIX domain-containing protein [Nitratireductor sp. GISD-1A_MAKvit]|uniref:NUDIX hydrolase n=1 Tax=Nitratireductor sp. GISD-1A_MAKvit TaxID=3234198 RepID=UPI0034675401